MIVDQRLLGLADCLLHRVQLLGEIEAGTAFLDHRDHALQVPLGALQPLRDLGMGRVDMGAEHGDRISSPGGYGNRDIIRGSDRTWLLACDGQADNVVGVLRARRFLQDRLDGRTTPVRELLHHPVVFPDTLNALHALDRLHESRSGIGLVVDEYGHSEGIVTRADALRAIRSEHSDDADDDPMIVRREDGSYLIAGALPIDSLMETIALPLPPDAGYHTVAGLVLHQLRHMPKVGERVTVGDWQIEVVDLDKRRIDQVLVTRRE